MKISSLVILLCFTFAGLARGADPVAGTLEVVAGSNSGIVTEIPQAILKEAGKTVVGIISGERHEDFDKNLPAFFKDQWSRCSHCELLNISTYDENGNFDPKGLVAQLETNKSRVSFLFFNINWKFRPEMHKELVDEINKITNLGMLIIGNSGYAKDGESTVGISKTVLGQVPAVIIVGEINERERLLTASFFGPEMLTAVKPPRSYLSKGLGPSFFVARFAQNFTRRIPQEWITHFHEKKIKSRKLWPDTEDFFNR
jgi:hypothetical protein